MAIITLTTDLGDRDHYMASLKGVLLSLSPGVTLVDISHHISKFNILEAAFVLKSAFMKFPEGSVHLVAVDPGGDTGPSVVMKYEGHYFVGPDNGVLSLIHERRPSECFRVNQAELLEKLPARSFPGTGRYAPVAALLSQGTRPEEICEHAVLKETWWGEPTLSGNSLRGVIMHLDHFGNAITNIRKDEFLKVKGDRSFQVFIRNLRLPRIVSTYSDVSRGEALALFSDSGYLEIALREGSAAQLLGLKVQDMLTIEFTG